MKLMQISDTSQHTPSELQRTSSPDDESSPDEPPPKKVAAESSPSDEQPVDTESTGPVPSCSKDVVGGRSKRKMAKRFETVTIPRGEQPDQKNMPQQM